MTDRVWIAIETAVRAGLDDGGILEAPPKSDDEVMWLVATITDHVCAALPRSVYKAFRTTLDGPE